MLVPAGDGPAKGPDSEGFGPLRMWPGGLCLSRAIGDFDVGKNVLCCPHIQQVCMRILDKCCPAALHAPLCTQKLLSELSSCSSIYAAACNLQPEPARMPYPLH